MGTRGLYGFRKNGIDKTTYNHWDSYPDCLGRSVTEFCAANSLETLNALYDRIELVNESDKPTPEAINFCKAAGYVNTSVSTGRIDDWYCLLREMQGDLNALALVAQSFGKAYMIDNRSFIKDSLFCEHAYIINLDEGTLEYWKGFQKEAQNGNRYGETPEDGYFPCRLMASWPLPLVAAPGTEDVVQEMNALAGVDD